MVTALAVPLVIVTFAKEVALDVPPEIVALANVILFNVVTVFPSWIAVLPSVIAVAKFVSS
jgi:hypothetical protein